MALPLIVAGAVARAGLKKLATTAVKKAGSKGGTKVGQKVGKKVLESTKAPKYPSAKGKTVKSKVDGKVKTTSESGRKISKSAKEVEYKKKNLTEGQRLGSFKAQETKRTKAVVTSASRAREAAAPIIGKEVIKKRASQGVAAIALTDAAIQRNKNKKKQGK